MIFLWIRLVLEWKNLEMKKNFGPFFFGKFLRKWGSREQWKINWNLLLERDQEKTPLLVLKKIILKIQCFWAKPLEEWKYFFLNSKFCSWEICYVKKIFDFFLKEKFEALNWNFFTLKKNYFLKAFFSKDPKSLEQNSWLF